MLKENCPENSFSSASTSTPRHPFKYSKENRDALVEAKQFGRCQYEKEHQSMESKFEDSDNSSSLMPYLIINETPIYAAKIFDGLTTQNLSLSNKQFIFYDSPNKNHSALMSTSSKDCRESIADINRTPTTQTGKIPQ